METREERAVEHGDSSWPAKCLERVRSCYAGEEAARHGRLLDDAEDDGRKLLTEEQRARAKAVSSTFATRECCVCMDDEVDVFAAFVECGHAQVCVRCAERLSACPMCNTPGRSIRLYM